LVQPAQQSRGNAAQAALLNLAGLHQASSIILSPLQELKRKGDPAIHQSRSKQNINSLCNCFLNNTIFTALTNLHLYNLLKRLL